MSYVLETHARGRPLVSRPLIAAPQLDGTGNGSDFTEWAGPAKSHVLGVMELHPKSRIMGVVHGLSECVPVNSRAHRFVVDTLGEHTAMGQAERHPRRLLAELWVCEQVLTWLNSITPATLPADAGLYRKLGHQLIGSMGPEDLQFPVNRAAPADVASLLRRAALAFYTANPHRTPLYTSGLPADGRYTPQEAADSHTFAPSEFEAPISHHILHPLTDNLDLDRQTYIFNYQRAVDSLPQEWDLLRSWCSPEQRRHRIEAAEILSFPDYYFLAMQAQFGSDTTAEAQQLQQCVRVNREPYAQWEARFRYLVRRTADRPPFQPADLITHYLTLLSAGWGKELATRVHDALLALPRERRTIDALYIAATERLSAHDKSAAHADRYGLSIPRPPRSQSPAQPRDRSPAPQPSARDRAPTPARVSFAQQPQTHYTQDYSHDPYNTRPPSPHRRPWSPYHDDPHPADAALGSNHYYSHTRHPSAYAISHTMHPHLSPARSPAPSRSPARADSPLCPTCHNHSARQKCYIKYPWLATPDWRPPHPQHQRDLWEQYYANCIQSDTELRFPRPLPSTPTADPSRSRSPARSPHQPPPATTPGGRPLNQGPLYHTATPRPADIPDTPRQRQPPPNYQPAYNRAPPPPHPQAQQDREQQRYGRQSPAANVASGSSSQQPQGPTVDSWDPFYSACVTIAPDDGDDEPPPLRPGSPELPAPPEQPAAPIPEFPDPLLRFIADFTNAPRPQPPVHYTPEQQARATAIFQQLLEEGAIIPVPAAAPQDPPAPTALVTGFLGDEEERQRYYRPQRHDHPLAHQPGLLSGAAALPAAFATRRITRSDAAAQQPPAPAPTPAPAPPSQPHRPPSRAPVPFAPTPAPEAERLDLRSQVPRTVRVRQQPATPPVPVPYAPVLAADVYRLSELAADTSQHFVEITIPHLLAALDVSDTVLPFFRGPNLLVFEGVGLERYAVPLPNVRVRLPGADVVALQAGRLPEWHPLAPQPAPAGQQEQQPAPPAAAAVAAASPAPSGTSSVEEPAPAAAAAPAAATSPTPSGVSSDKEPAPAAATATPPAAESPAPASTASSDPVPIPPPVFTFGASSPASGAPSRHSYRRPRGSTGTPPTACGSLDSSHYGEYNSPWAGLHAAASPPTNSGPVVLSTRLYDRPTVATVPGGDPQQGATLLVAGRHAGCHAFIPDSGANVSLMTEKLAQALRVEVDTKSSIPVNGTADSPTTTLGRITTPISITFCDGTAGEVTVCATFHVIRGAPKQDWDLLLGTDTLNLIGAAIDLSVGRLIYRPTFPCTPNSVHPSTLPTWSMPLRSSITP